MRYIRLHWPKSEGHGVWRFTYPARYRIFKGGLQEIVWMWINIIRSYWITIITCLLDTPNNAIRHIVPFPFPFPFHRVPFISGISFPLPPSPAQSISIPIIPIHKIVTHSSVPLPLSIKSSHTTFPPSTSSPAPPSPSPPPQPHTPPPPSP